MSVNLPVLPSVKNIVHPGLCFAYLKYVGVCASYSMYHDKLSVKHLKDLSS